MATAELVMNRRIVWDSKKLRQIDEAKAEYLKFKRAGYEIVDSAGKVVERFKPALEEIVIRARKVAGHVMKVLSENGDDRLVWDRENGREAMEAKKKFVDLIKKGYKAYSVDDGGKKKAKIEEFDVDAEEILMVPPTVKG